MVAVFVGNIMQCGQIELKSSERSFLFLKNIHHLEFPVTKAYGVAVTCSKTTFGAAANSGSFRNLDTGLSFFML